MPLPQLPFRSAARLNAIDSIPEEPEDQLDPGIVSQIGRSAIGGLSRVGNLLDLPGSMVRDVLALKNPLDQLLSPTTDKNRTSGRDLLRQYGMVGRKDTWGNFAGSLGAEILLDPLTYLTFGGSAAAKGALTKGGQAAHRLGILEDAVRAKLGTGQLLESTSGATSKLGKVAEKVVPGRMRAAVDMFKDASQKVVGPRTARSQMTLGEALELTGKNADNLEDILPKLNAGVGVDELLNQRLGGSAAIQFPFSRSSRVINNEGFNRAVDIAGNLIQFSSPVRHLTPFFSKAAQHGHTTEEGIKSAIITARDAAKANQKLKMDLVDMIRPIDELFSQADSNGKYEEISSEVWDYMEGHITDAPERSAEFKQVKQHLDKLMEMSKEIKALENAAGIPTEQLDDLINEYVPRLRVFFDQKHKMKTGRNFVVYDTMTQNRLARKLRDVSTAVVNRLSLNKKYSGARHRPDWDDIKRDLWDEFMRDPELEGQLPIHHSTVRQKEIAVEGLQQAENEVSDALGRRRDTPKQYGPDEPHGNWVVGNQFAPDRGPNDPPPPPPPAAGPASPSPSPTTPRNPLDVDSATDIEGAQARGESSTIQDVSGSQSPESLRYQDAKYGSIESEDVLSDMIEAIEAEPENYVGGYKGWEEGAKLKPKALEKIEAIRKKQLRLEEKQIRSNATRFKKEATWEGDELVHPSGYKVIKQAGDAPTSYKVLDDRGSTRGEFDTLDEAIEDVAVAEAENPGNVFSEVSASTDFESQLREGIVEALTSKTGENVYSTVAEIRDFLIQSKWGKELSDIKRKSSQWKEVEKVLKKMKREGVLDTAIGDSKGNSIRTYELKPAAPSPPPQATHEGMVASSKAGEPEQFGRVTITQRADGTFQAEDTFNGGSRIYSDVSKDALKEKLTKANLHTKVPGHWKEVGNKSDLELMSYEELSDSLEALRGDSRNKNKKGGLRPAAAKKEELIQRLMDEEKVRRAIAQTHENARAANEGRAPKKISVGHPEDDMDLSVPPLKNMAADGDSSIPDEFDEVDDLLDAADESGAGDGPPPPDAPPETPDMPEGDDGGTAALSSEEVAQINREAAINATYRDDRTKTVNDMHDEAVKNTRELFDTIVRLDPRHADEGVPVFNTNPLEATYRRVEVGNNAIATANASYRLAAERAVVAAHADEIPAGYVSLVDALRKTKIDPVMAENHFFENHAKHLSDEVDQKLLEYLEDADPIPGQRIGAIHIPEHISEEIVRVMNHMTAGDNFYPVLEVVDKITNFFKGGVTTVFPAFHARNLGSGQLQNYFGEAWSAESVKEIANFHKNGEIGGLQDIPMFEGMKDEEATQKFIELAYVHGLVGNQGWHNDILPGVGEKMPLAREIPEGPATNFRNMKASLKLPFKTRWNPLNTRGVGKETNEFLPSAVGQDIGNIAENMNRLSPFYKLLKDGMNPSAAAMQVKMLQVDYSKLSKFEREVMRRIFPFYSFTRGVTPAIAEMLMERPGGRMGQTIRAARLAKDENSNVLPDYVSETAAIPLGKGPKGDDQYVTGFGLMMEDPFSFVGGPRNAGLETLSRMNPLIKGPLEFVTGTTFFQRGPNGGRPLTDLDPTLGRLLANVAGRDTPVQTPQSLEMILGNSPAARFLTTARGLTDSRKSLGSRALNTLTGMKISTVSESAQDAILRERAADIMRQLGGLEFTRSYATEELLESLSPNKAEALRQLQDFMNILATRAKARKEAREAAAQETESQLTQ